MWRTAAIALTAPPVIASTCGVVVMTGLATDAKPTTGWRLYVLAFMAFCLIPHPVIRLIIAADSVVLLRDLPDTAFLVLSWSDIIPSL